ncbi:MAG: lipid-binding SYLF domain-containing protein [Burkholderiales bacterium]|nr:lipid-binding SYLF domain-containing protein [Burkholderiales bacterium]
MNKARRTFNLAGGALAVAVFAGATFPALASDASDASELALKAQATIAEFGANKDFPTFSPALAKAKAVLIFPQILKAGFVLGGSGGSGVLMVRDAKTGGWVGPAFYTMGSASLGFQAGASAAEVVMIINSQKALDSLYSNKVKIGGDASAAIGPKGVGTGAALSTDFVVYSTVKGAFAGMSVDGSVLDVRQTLNKGYYGKPATPVEILVKGEHTKPEAAALQAAVKKAAT